MDPQSIQEVLDPLWKVMVEGAATGFGKQGAESLGSLAARIRTRRRDRGAPETLESREELRTELADLARDEPKYAAQTIQVINTYINKKIEGQNINFGNQNKYGSK